MLQSKQAVKVLAYNTQRKQDESGGHENRNDKRSESDKCIVHYLHENKIAYK